MYILMVVEIACAVIVDQFIRNRIYGFMKRLVSSSNALVLSAVTNDARYRSKIVRHWLKLLYVHFDGG